MALDRWIALVFVLIFLIYGYTAFLDGPSSCPNYAQESCGPQLSLKYYLFQG